MLADEDRAERSEQLLNAGVHRVDLRTGEQAAGDAALVGHDRRRQPGGAHAARQYLAAGLVDEMELNLAPVLLGAGERLFDGVGDDLHGLQLVRTVAAPGVTHLKFARA